MYNLWSWLGFWRLTVHYLVLWYCLLCYNIYKDFYSGRCLPSLHHFIYFCAAISPGSSPFSSIHRIPVCHLCYQSIWIFPSYRLELEFLRIILTYGYTVLAVSVLCNRIFLYSHSSFDFHIYNSGQSISLYSFSLWSPFPLI